MTTTLAYRVPLRQCLRLAERRLSDAASAMDGWHGEDAELAGDLEQQARDFLAEATAQGWTGDADAVVAAWWAEYRG
jgi:hypothetical protein